MSRYNEIDGLEPPLVEDFYDQLAHQDADAVALARAGDERVLEQAEADPPPAPPELELGGGRGGAGGGGSAGGGGRRPETLRGVVERVASSGTGLQLAGVAGWLDVSKFAAPPVDLSALQPGDAVELVIDTSSAGKRYIRALRRAAGSGAAGRGDEAEDEDAVPF